MPELPEVEITRQKLAPLLLGRTVARVSTTAPSYFFLTPPATLRKRLRGQTVKTLERHGKYLVAHFESGAGLLLHLGMTGQLFSSEAASPRLRRHTQSLKVDQHTHLELTFDDGGPRVYFRDVRKFGKCAWLDAGTSHPRLLELGPDALRLTSSHLAEVAERRNTPIKTLLLDQKAMAGIGNIYADEALFLAKVRPTRRARSLTEGECRALARAVRNVLAAAVRSGGTSMSDFVHPDGEDGSFQTETAAYGRTGEPCRRCRTAIRRITLNGRSSHFCPSCQG